MFFAELELELELVLRLLLNSNSNSNSFSDHRVRVQTDRKLAPVVVFPRTCMRYAVDELSTQGLQSALPCTTTYYNTCYEHFICFPGCLYHDGEGEQIIERRWCVPSLLCGARHIPETTGHPSSQIYLRRCCSCGPTSWSKSDFCTVEGREPLLQPKR